MNRWPIIGALLFGACGPALTRTSSEQDVFRRTERAWVEAGLPEPGACLANAKVLAADEAEYRAWCGGEGWSCLQWQNGLIERNRGPVIVLAPQTKVDELGEPLIHEALHALYSCTLPRLTNYDPYDAQHTDPRVWAAKSVNSAQSRARRSR